jgi:iron complex transport system permease protein
VGIALLFIFQSLLSLVQFTASAEVSQQILFWLFGSLTKSTWSNVSVVVVVSGICIALLMRDNWKLTALRLGEQRASALGVNITRLRIKTLILVAMMTATAISFVGVIGFIGLVAPHVARLLVGEDQRYFLPATMLAGAAFLSFSSVLSKVIVPGALFPVGIVTSFVGVPFLFWIIWTKR